MILNSRKQGYIEKIEGSLLDREYEDVEVSGIGRGIKASWCQHHEDGNLRFVVSGPEAEVYNFVEYFFPEDIHM
jgi:hypothetical protein